LDEEEAWQADAISQEDARVCETKFTASHARFDPSNTDQNMERSNFDTFEHLPGRRAGRNLTGAFLTPNCVPAFDDC
jgi:hypothetical protein